MACHQRGLRSACPRACLPLGLPLRVSLGTDPPPGLPQRAQPGFRWAGRPLLPAPQPARGRGPALGVLVPLCKSWTRSLSSSPRFLPHTPGVPGNTRFSALQSRPSPASPDQRVPAPPPGSPATGSRGPVFRASVVVGGVCAPLCGGGRWAWGSWDPGHGHCVGGTAPRAGTPTMCLPGGQNSAANTPAGKGDLVPCALAGPAAAATVISADSRRRCQLVTRAAGPAASGALLHKQGALRAPRGTLPGLQGSGGSMPGRGGPQT